MITSMGYQMFSDFSQSSAAHDPGCGNGHALNKTTTLHQNCQTYNTCLPKVPRFMVYLSFRR